MSGELSASRGMAEASFLIAACLPVCLLQDFQLFSIITAPKLLLHETMIRVPSGTSLSHFFFLWERKNNFKVGMVSLLQWEGVG